MQDLVGRSEVYSISRIVQNRERNESISQIEFRSILKLSAAMPFSFVEERVRDIDGYKNWMQPVTTASLGNVND